MLLKVNGKVCDIQRLPLKIGYIVDPKVASIEFIETSQS